MYHIKQLIISSNNQNHKNIVFDRNFDDFNSYASYALILTYYMQLYMIRVTNQNLRKPWVFSLAVTL